MQEVNHSELLDHQIRCKEEMKAIVCKSQDLKEVDWEDVVVFFANFNLNINHAIEEGEEAANVLVQRGGGSGAANVENEEWLTIQRQRKE